MYISFKFTVVTSDRPFAFLFFPFLFFPGLARILLILRLLGALGDFATLQQLKFPFGLIHRKRND